MAIKTIVINKGLKGDDGNSVLNGTGVPSPTLGVNGDFYIDTSVYDIYGPKTAGLWGSPTPLSGGGGSGANTALSNLVSTAVNADIVPGSAGTINLGSLANPYATTWANILESGLNQALDIKTNDRSDASSAPNLSITSGSYTGVTSSRRAGQISITTGTSTQRGGIMTIGPGSADILPGSFTLHGSAGTSSASGGHVNILGGTSLVGDTGWILLSTTDASNPGGGSSGSLYFSTGEVLDGISGDMFFTIGQSVGSGSSGNFKFLKTDTPSVAGQVWTASDVDGTGYWAPATGGGANTSLSNLSAVSINSDLLFDVDEGYNVGDATNRLAGVYTRQVRAETLNLVLQGTSVDLQANTPLRFKENDNTDHVQVKAPTSLAASYTLTWPTDAGSSGQVLSTDGFGDLSWADAGSGGGSQATGVQVLAPIIVSDPTPTQILFTNTDAAFDTDNYAASANELAVQADGLYWLNLQVSFAIGNSFWSFGYSINNGAIVYFETEPNIGGYGPITNGMELLNLTTGDTVQLWINDGVGGVNYTPKISLASLGGSSSSDGGVSVVQLSDGAGGFTSDAGITAGGGQLSINGASLNPFRAFSSAGVMEAFFGTSASPGEAFVITKWAGSYTDLHIFSATANHLVLDNTGKVGIGSNSMLGKLHVENTISEDLLPAITLRNGDSPTQYGFDFMHRTAVVGDLTINRVSSGLSTEVIRVRRDAQQVQIGQTDLFSTGDGSVLMISGMSNSNILTVRAEAGGSHGAFSMGSLATGAAFIQGTDSALSTVAPLRLNGQGGDLILGSGTSYVGVGTDSPAHPLDVLVPGEGNDGIAITAKYVSSLFFNSTDVNPGRRNWGFQTEIDSLGAFSLRYGTSNGASISEKSMVWAPNGNVGIGVVPTQPLHVFSLAEPSDGGMIALFDTGAGNNYLQVKAGTAQFIQGVDRDTRGFFGMLSGDPLSVRTANVERINIDENGHVNVVNTLSVQGNVKLRYTTNSGQSLVNTGGNNQIIIFDDAGGYDNSGGAWNAGTGEFTAPHAGYYAVHSTVTVDHAAETGVFMLDIVVNGTEVARGQRLNVVSGGTTGAHLSDVLYLAASDVLSVRVRNETDGTVELEGYGPSNFIAISELP